MLLVNLHTTPKLSERWSEFETNPGLNSLYQFTYFDQIGQWSPMLIPELLFHDIEIALTVLLISFIFWIFLFGFSLLTTHLLFMFFGAGWRRRRAEKLRAHFLKAFGDI